MNNVQIPFAGAAIERAAIPPAHATCSQRPCAARIIYSAHGPATVILKLSSFRPST